jgi:hypothetical protein
MPERRSPDPARFNRERRTCRAEAGEGGNHAKSVSAITPVGAAGFDMAKTTRIAHSCPMKIAEDVHKYDAEPGIAEEEALKKGMEEKSKELVQKGAEVYVK